MPRQLNSFLLRWWRGDESERLEIEHIQSGRKLLTSSIEDALAWLDGQMNADQERKAAGSDEPDALNRE